MIELPKKLPFLIGLTLCWLASTAFATTEPAIIPQPQKMEVKKGVFELTAETLISFDGGGGSAKTSCLVAPRDWIQTTGFTSVNRD
jgi:hypothetical protein